MAIRSPDHDQQWVTAPEIGALILSRPARCQGRLRSWHRPADQAEVTRKRVISNDRH